ncbi:MAG: L-threonylcarbamoyladenylate synthase [Flavobacteriaceae bacterium]|jgi:tRNA threonylcarbamoyl adenosine modification protein (Sua5/YciO/YrdC/YwlC family)|nr:L-threonylcarbamoyladenylate synthase [Flavobacteriaceae bacterium]MDG1941376.1 L-threonylcarbamoyladenylate synthase [Flavobacteriaceae bacterium]|tara:strand:+ start:427 stop:1044 length:618 start_codon:yes stop_codon:yes gene_type:complete
MAELLKFYASKPNLKFLKKAAETLEQGGLIIYPTDTVYALGCLSNNLKGLQRLASIKDVKLDKAPFSFFMRDFSDLSQYVKPLDNTTFKLLKRCLPGPYTFILPSLKLHKPFEKRKSIGIRMAQHPIVVALMDLLKAPLITTSLHDQDEILDYTTDPDVIYERWESSIDLMLEDGFGGNIPSTVVDLCGSTIEIIREGKGDLELL